jgi:ribosomal protein S18 acetylase RimI-like enzyme
MMALHHLIDTRFRVVSNGENLFRQSYRQQATDRNACVLVADAQGAVIGYTIGTVRLMHELLEPRFVGYITDISVAPAARRRGVGRALVAAMKLWYRERGIRVILLRAGSHNPVSLAFWEAMGWSEHMREMWWEEAP